MTIKNYFIFRHQPLKAAYLAYVTVTFIFLRIPWWLATSLLPDLRPRRSWTIRRTLLLKSIQVIYPAVFNTALFKRLRVDPSRYKGVEDKAGLVWIDAVLDLVVGDIKAFAERNGVSAEQVPGYWFGAEGGTRKSALPGEKVILAFHAGGSVLGDASPHGSSAMLCNDMLSHFPQFSRLLNIEYRLSQGPPLPSENPFPAALIDAIMGYNYLVRELGFSPANILVMGESAGGTLALQLVKYLVTNDLPGLSPPGGLLLLSPSMDWGNSLDDPESSASRNYRTDWVHAFAAGYTGRALRGRLSASDATFNSWTWPAADILGGRSDLGARFPPSFILGGGAEMTLDAMRAARDAMATAAGEDKVELAVLEDATHIALSLPWHEEEKEEGYRLMAAWVNAHFPPC